MIEAKEVAKYTGNELDFHICNALIKQNKRAPLEEGVSRSWIISEIRRATSISEYITPIEAEPSKVSRRLSALNKLNILKSQKKGSNFKWFYNMGIELQDIVFNESVKNAVIEVKPSIIVTTLEAINPNKNKIKTEVNNVLKQPKPAVLLNITNNNKPKNPNLYYYFIRYKGSLENKTQFHKSEFIAVPFSIYANDHKHQIESKLLDINKNLADNIKLILISAV
jgi:hypothetical protein